MRQFFTWRIWAAFGALAGLALLLLVVLPDSAASNEPASSGIEPRQIDFIALVFQVTTSDDFLINDDVVTSGSADLVIDGQRTMHIFEGTLGSNDCPNSGVAQCAVLADLLGEAVVWFALVPLQDGLKVAAPAIVDLLGNSIVQLSNGWLLRTAEQVDRKCAQETGSLSEFVSKFGPGSVTTIDVSMQRITSVTCSSNVTSSD